MSTRYLTAHRARTIRRIRALAATARTRAQRCDTCHLANNGACDNPFCVRCHV